MRLLLRILLCAPGVLFALLVNAQDTKMDFARINQVYEKMSRISVDAVYSLFPSHTATKPFTVQTGTSKINGGVYFNRASGVEALHNDRIDILVDNNSKTIYLGKSLKSAPRKKLEFNLDSLLSMYDSIAFDKVGASEYRYTFFFDEGTYTSTQVVFNPKNYHVLKMVLFYSTPEEDMGSDEPPRLEISYSNLNSNPKFTAEDFSETRYFTIEKGKYLPKPAYRKYRFINTLN